MSIRHFIERAQELEALRRQFPDAKITLTGIGFYAPELTVEQWERYHGAPAPDPGVSSPGAAPNVCEGRFSRRTASSHR